MCIIQGKFGLWEKICMAKKKYFNLKTVFNFRNFIKSPV